MKYFPFHIGDWMSATEELNPIEEHLYFKLLLKCYSTESGLTRSYCERVANVLRSYYEVDLDYVLSTYFYLGEDNLYHNSRAEKEIVKQKEKSEKARKSIACRYERTNNERSTNELPTKNQEPRTNNKESREKHMLSTDFKLPEKWKEYCKLTRNTLDPHKVFDEFKAYWISEELERTDNGWTKAWQGWVRRVNETPQNKLSEFDIPVHDVEAEREAWFEQQRKKEKANEDAELASLENFVQKSINHADGFISNRDNASLPLGDDDGFQF